MPGPAMTRVLDKLDRVTGHGDAVVASCPVPSHGSGRGDINPSLSVKYIDGKVLLNCMTGCHPQDILLALGLEWPDLWDDAPTDRWGVKVAEWTYQRPDGTPYFKVERWQNATGKRFVQRVPGHTDEQGREKAGYPGGFKPCLFNLPAVLAAARDGGTVYVVEGEKSISAANALGLVATTGPNGAKAWQPYYTAWLKGCGQVYVVVDNDADGQRYAAEVTASIRGQGIPCQALAVAVDTPKADLYDHVKAGYGVGELTPVNLNRLRPDGVPIDVILATTYPPVTWAIPGILPSGLALLGGTVKQGKSICALDIALAVASNGVALGGLDCRPGSVLYLSLDNDTESRIKSRTMHLLGYPSSPADFPIEVHTSWPVGTEAVAAAQEWVEECEDPLLVVIDTMVRAEPTFEGDGRGGAYSQSVQVLSRWSDFAQSNNLAVVAVHHTRKAGGEDMDWIDRFLGSRGLVATAQTLLMIESERGADEGVLHVAGRDVKHQDLGLLRKGWGWVVQTPPLRAVQ